MYIRDFRSKQTLHILQVCCQFTLLERYLRLIGLRISLIKHERHDHCIFQRIHPNLPWLFQNIDSNWSSQFSCYYFCILFCNAKAFCGYGLFIIFSLLLVIIDKVMLIIIFAEIHLYNRFQLIIIKIPCKNIRHILTV